MTSFARKFFIASLIYLILGLLAQAVNVFDLWLGFNPLAYTAVVAAEQILLAGWLTQLGLALVYDRWLRPAGGDQSLPASTLPPPSAQRHPLPLALPVFILFNLGLPLTIIGQPGLVLFGDWRLGAAAALGGLLQFTAGSLFVYEVWRVLRKK